VPISNNSTGLAFGNGTFIATARYLNTVLVSTDGVTWSVIDIDVNVSGFGNYIPICFGDNTFVISSYNSSNQVIIYYNKLQPTPFGIYSTPATTY
jgi:hypothetical protein